MNGKPVGKRGWIRDDFEQALKDAGITKFRFRDSRRTFGTQQALMGTNLKVIAELMGHKSTRMTEPYVQIARSTKKDALDKLGERLAGPQAPQTATDKVKGKTQIMS
ncbi:MAG TPA: tyrosine-type recombinase/integrase [Elusimicrobiota bacterium]|nr:tyrosine-type recombinase/integrase [Elusimicrobiota bacterium]